MAGKFGSPSAWFLVDGYDLTTAKLKSDSRKLEALTEDTSGLGDSAGEHTPTGTVRLTITQSGALFDTATAGLHAAMVSSVPTSPQATARVMCLGFEGQVSGARFYGAQQFSVAYEPLAQLGGLTKANVEYRTAGPADQGEIVQPTATKTADWNTKSLGTQVDSGASSSNGGVGYLQVTACSGFTNFVGKIRDSSDDVTYADLVTFTDNVVAPFAERSAVAGTVDRYLSFDGNVTGSGSITVFAGFARNSA